MPFGMFADDEMNEFITPAMQRQALGMGLAQAAQGVGGATGGRRFGSYLGDAMGGFTQGSQSAINNMLAQQNALSGLLDDKRKRKEFDRLDKYRKKREKMFGDYRTGKQKSPLPPEVQEAMNQVYDLYGEEGAQEFLLEYYKKKAEADFDTGTPQDDWMTLNEEDMAAVEQDRNIFLDRNRLWQLNRKDKQLRDAGAIAGAEHDLTGEQSSRIAMAMDFLNDWDGTPTKGVGGRPATTMRKQLYGDDEIDEETGEVISDKPGIADWSFKQVADLKNSRLYNTGEWNRFVRRMEKGKKALIHQLTGTGMTLQEAEQNAEQWMPQPNDSRDTVIDKAEQLAETLRGGVLMGRSGGHKEEYLKRLRRTKQNDMLRILDPDYFYSSGESRRARYGG